MFDLALFHLRPKFARRGAVVRPRSRFRPTLEHLEERRVPSTITDLGILPGGRISYAYKVNTAGDAVGYASTDTGEQHGVLFSDGTLQDLGTIGSGKTSNAYGINDQGLIVGYTTTAAQGTGQGAQHAFYYDGVMHDMGTMGGETSDAWNINNNGQVIGYSDTIPGFGIPHAFLWTVDGGFQDLGTLGGAISYGYGINENGDATGSAQTVAGYLHAYVYSNGVMSDIGTLPGGNYSQGWAINENGDVAGFSTVDGDTTYHAFAYIGGVMTDLGTLGGDHSIAYSINNNGEVVGTSETTPGHPAANPFIYRDGVFSNLKDYLPMGTDWNLLDGRYITDNDLVVGVGRHGSSQDYHGFILDLNAPDPSTAAAGAALQGLAARPTGQFPAGLTTDRLAGKPLPATATPTEATPANLSTTDAAAHFVAPAQANGGDATLIGNLGIDGFFNGLS